MITLQQLFEFIAQDQELDSTDWTLDTTLDSLGIDSLAKMELVFRLEDQYKITIPNDDISVSTLQEVLALVNRHLP
jgi:acyl carrier protein